MDAATFDRSLAVLLSQPTLRCKETGRTYVPSAFGDGWVDLSPQDGKPSMPWRVNSLDGFELVKDTPILES